MTRDLSYSIPKNLARELHKETEADAVPEEEIKENIKNSYQKQAYKLADVVNGPTPSYKERMQTVAEQAIEPSDKPKRQRRKRWDVTPEERARLLQADSEESSGYLPLSANEKNTQEVQQLIVKAPDITGLDFYRPEDERYFGALEELKLKPRLTLEEQLDVAVMELILKVKNGNPTVRKKALRSITTDAKSIGATALFKHILPLLVEPSFEDQERHLIVKLIGRLLFTLDTEVKPHTYKILMAVAPLLIDEDFNLRLEANEIISTLSKSVGLAVIVSAMRPDLSNNDEYLRNLASRILAVVANTLGLVRFFPFLKVVVKSKTSWQTRHTGIKIIQQMCNQLGPGNGTPILPYSKQLVELLIPAISDENLSIRSITATTIRLLAETVHPYGIESFEPVLEPLWVGLKRHRGRALAAFIRCLGSIIPLMERDSNYEEYLNYYTRELVFVMSREFSSQDDEMRGTILRILAKLPLSRQLVPKYQRDIFDPFFRYFWNRRTASDIRSLYKLVTTATTELSKRLNFLQVIERILIFTKDDNEPLRRMAVDSIARIVNFNPTELIGMTKKFEEQLLDGMLFAFQEQKTFNRVYLNGLAAVSRALGIRLKPHLNSILSTVLYQIKNKSPEVRQEAALLIAAIAPVIKVCTEGESDVLQKLILILYESLGEAYPDVLAAILSALNACLDSFDSEDLLGLTNPSITQLLPSLSPILKNRQESVQEACILVIGLIAKKSPEIINVREWMRICFDLLDTLKSPKKRIRIAANQTFGEISRTIGPQDVLTMLLNNLRVQERQLRVCTAVAIGIVAEVCSPFTVLPAIMNEYRTPDTNVQNGVLKAMTFLFEYLDGNSTKDYLYAITPLLQDALTDRDQVHRQTAATVVKHIALNCTGCINDEQIEIFIHLMNFVVPNIFETSPHVISRIVEAVDALKMVIGYGRYMNYVWAGLFHPARKVRNAYWKLFNMAYVQLADAIVPYYPVMTNFNPDSEDSFQVEEFDLFI